MPDSVLSPAQPDRVCADWGGRKQPQAGYVTLRLLADGMPDLHGSGQDPAGRQHRKVEQHRLLRRCNGCVRKLLRHLKGPSDHMRAGDHQIVVDVEPKSHHTPVGMPDPDNRRTQRMVERLIRHYDTSEPPVFN
nr:hypothetical protein [Micromonospora sagamiensis]